MSRAGRPDNSKPIGGPSLDDPQERLSRWLRVLQAQPGSAESRSALAAYASPATAPQEQPTASLSLDRSEPVEQDWVEAVLAWLQNRAA